MQAALTCSVDPPTPRQDHHRPAPLRWSILFEVSAYFVAAFYGSCAAYHTQFLWTKDAWNPTSEPCCRYQSCCCCWCCCCCWHWSCRRHFAHWFCGNHTLQSTLNQPPANKTTHKPLTVQLTYKAGPVAVLEITRQYIPWKINIVEYGELVASTCPSDEVLCLVIIHHAVCAPKDEWRNGLGSCCHRTWFFTYE